MAGFFVSRIPRDAAAHRSLRLCIRDRNDRGTCAVLDYGIATKMAGAGRVGNLPG
jgi:hypothetical protein